MYANKSAAKSLGVTVNEIIGGSISEFVEPTQVENTYNLIKEIFENNRPLSDYDLKIRKRNGQFIEAVLSAVPVSYMGKKAILLSYRDITERKRMEQALKANEEKLRALFEYANDAIFLFQLTEDEMPARYIDVNQSACNLLGYTKDELLEMSPINLTPRDRWNNIPVLAQKILLQGKLTFEGAYLSKNGKEVPFEFSASVLDLDGEKAILSLGRDITERKKSEKLMEQLAFYDYLTHLPNRRLFEERLQEAITKTNSVNGLTAVLFLDLDGFKKINDTFGHDMGDSLLIEVAQRLKGIVGKDDLVARLAGDEFTILLQDITKEGTISTAQQILDVLNTPFLINKENLFISPSIGIAFYTNENIDAKTLIKHADYAMYQAKKQGKNNYQIY